jgi:RimJ/RimL family protein N-acetyltransferase
MYRHAGMDIFLTTPRHGQGLGTEAIRLLARYLFEERGHHRLTIDPAADNVAAIRAYERVGFRRVGIMRNYERGPDGCSGHGTQHGHPGEQMIDSVLSDRTEADTGRFELARF